MVLPSHFLNQPYWQQQIPVICDNFRCNTRRREEGERGSLNQGKKRKWKNCFICFEFILYKYKCFFHISQPNPTLLKLTLTLVQTINIPSTPRVPRTYFIPSNRLGWACLTAWKIFCFKENPPSQFVEYIFRAQILLLLL